MKNTEVTQYLDSLKIKGIVPGLFNIKELCKRLGNPQDKLSFVHIAGTNGKGSVLAYVSTVLACAGYKVGRYFSPSIWGYGKNMQINGRPVSRELFCECVEEVKKAGDSMAAQGLAAPTLFETETAAAFLCFQKKGCDIVVLEAGMGGREDATNLIETTKVAVLASISMDHMNFLGNTLEEIAGKKAGIIKKGCFVVTATQNKKITDVIKMEAEKYQCPVTKAGAALKVKYGLERQKFTYKTGDGVCFDNLEISQAGQYQIENAVLAVETIGKLALCGYPVSEKQLRKGLLEASWPGRFQIASKKPLFILDGAHNEDAAKKLAQSIRFYFTNKRIIYIMGMLRDKETEKVIAETYLYAEHVITVTPPDNPRAMAALDLAQAVKGYHPCVTAAGSLEEAVEMAYLLAAKEDVIISFGSLSYLGRLLDILEKRQKCDGERKAGIQRRKA